MKFAILRTGKLKTAGSIAAASAHNNRLAKVNGAAVDRERYNTVIGAKNARDGVMARISDLYPPEGKKPRKNAVLAVETVLTASPEFFDEIQPDWRSGNTSVIDLWVKDNIQFMNDFWGAENVIQAAVHYDESTPHIHVISVPEKNGKLNCREIIGGKEKLRQLQTDYAKEMAKHGLERGVSKSAARHIPVKDFWAGKADDLKKLKPATIMEHVGFMDNREKQVLLLTRENVVRLNSMNASVATKELERRARAESKKAEKALESAEKQRQQNIELQQKIVKMGTEITRLEAIEEQYEQEVMRAPGARNNKL